MSGQTVARISDHGVRTAAGKLGVTVAEYREHEAKDEHWCSMCRYWLPRRAFYISRRSPRGCSAICKTHQVAAGQRRGSVRRGRVTYAGPAYSTPAPAGVAILPDAAPARAGHRYCPASLGCRSGRLPEGWVREGAV